MSENHNPYVGPRTFKEEERHLFFGRDREALDLVSLVISERLVLFYAQSGAGKSSLVNTKLIPGLHEEDEYTVLPVGRVGGAEVLAEAQIDNIYMHNLLHSLLKEHGRRDFLSKLPFTEFLQHFLEKDEDGYQRHVLIIDQFEELFSMYPEKWEKRKDFFMQLAQAMKEFPRLWIVLVMREDYIAYLDPYVYLLPGKLRVRYYMQRLEGDGALKAIKEPVKNLRPFAEGVADRLVENLAGIKVQRAGGNLEIRPGQFIEPLQLQVVCHYLWEHLPPGPEITFEDLRLIGDVDQILVKYYDGRVSRVAEEKHISQRRIRTWFEEYLITSSGLRNMILQGQDETGGLDNRVIEAFLGDLVRAERRGGVVFYEITHDRLVEPIRAGNKKWFDENLSPLQKQAALWNDHQRNESWLLTEQALAEVEEWAWHNPDELTEIEEDFLRASKQHQAQLSAQLESHQRELEAAERLASEQKRSAQRGKILSIVAATFALLFLLVSFWTFTNQKRAEEIAATTVLEQAGKLHDTGFYEDSIEKFRLAKDLDPNVIEGFEDPNILSNLCADLSLFGDPADAPEVCDIAVRADPNNGIFRDKRGINRALLGNLPGATEDFAIAVRWYTEQNSQNLVQIRKDWIGQLQSGNNPLADKDVFDDLKAQALIESVTQLDNLDRHEEMVSRFLEAKRLDPNIVSTIQNASVLNNVCWWGSLYMKAPRVTDACERSVSLSPGDGNHIDSRGLNRALLGDYPGAMADFQAAVEWFVEIKEDETIITKRRNWILALSSNQDPFTPEVLEELKYETPIEGS